MQNFLRLKTAQGLAVSVGDLSAQVREITGQSWGAFWEPKYGNLLNFLKSHPDSFTVLKSKYVTCKGQEEIALRQLDREAADQSTFFHEQSRLQASYSYVPINTQLQYQQQQQSAIHQSYYQHQEQAAYPQNAFYTAPFDDPFNLTTPSFEQQSSYEPFVPSNHMQQPFDWTVRRDSTQSRSNSVISRADSSDWQLPETNAFNSYIAPLQVPKPQPLDDWWNVTHPPTAVDPFNMSDLGAIAAPSAIRLPEQEDEEKIKKEVEKQARKLKKQEEEDQALARELQKQEYREVVGNTSRSATSDSTTETIVLTTTQMRDLAEKELGIDNVRIIAGFTVKKFGREGRPHQRKMWVTQSLTHLAWASSLLEGSHRGIELKHVTEVTSGQLTPTIARYTSDKNKVRTQCFSLVTQARTLDLQACSVIQRDALVNALKAVVEFNHKYRPEKVDRELTRIRLTGNAHMFTDKKKATGID